MRHWSLIVIMVVLLVACGAAPAPPPTPSASAVPAATSVATRTSLPAATPTPLPLATPLPTAPPTPALPSYDLVLRGGTLIDGTDAPPLADAAIAIRDGRIAAVGPASSIPFSPDTPVRDLPGTTFLPGFINAHAHTWTLADDELHGWVRAGVTTLRDLSGPRELLVTRRDTLASDPNMPRLFVAGPMVTVARGHPIPIYGLSDRVLTVNGVEHAAQIINGLLDDGVDLIKIAVSGRTDTAWPELLDEEIRAIADAAQDRKSTRLNSSH